MKGARGTIPSIRRMNVKNLGHRSRLALTLVAAGGTFVSVTAIAGVQSAQAAPSRLLQAVDVTLGPDGSVQDLSATNIAESGSAAHARTTVYSPQQDASALPVSVTVSWSDGGQTGTNLSQLAGRSGTIEVDYTVTNDTVHSQQVTYTPPGGATQTTWALVADPVTVVAAAQLPKGSFSQVQAPSGGGPQASQSNGVIQSGGTGPTSVQWASILAPPALASVTTFRLVEQTNRFVVPKFTLTAEQGLITDPTTQNLVESAFGKGGGGLDLLTTVENDTVQQMQTVQLDLAEAADQLGKVQTQLAVTTAGLGQQAVTNVSQASSNLQTDASKLSGDLSALETGMTDTLGQTQNNAEQALGNAVNSLINYIGIGSTQQLTLPTGTAQCTVGSLLPPSGWSNQTLTEQLQLIVAQAGALSGAAKSCQTNLDATIEGEISSLDSSLGAAESATAALTASVGKAVADEESQMASAIEASLTDFATKAGQARGAVDTAITTASTDLAKANSDLTAALPVTASTLVPSTALLAQDAANIAGLSGNGGGLIGIETKDLGAVGNDLDKLGVDLANVSGDVTSDDSHLATANSEIVSANTDLAANGTVAGQDLGDLQGLATALGNDATTDLAAIKAGQTAISGYLDQICGYSDARSAGVALAQALGVTSSGCATTAPASSAGCTTSTPVLNLLGCVSTDLEEEQAIADDAGKGSTTVSTLAAWSTVLGQAQALNADLSSPPTTSFTTVPVDKTQDQSALNSASSDLSAGNTDLNAALANLTGSSAGKLSKAIDTLESDLDQTGSGLSSDLGAVSTDLATISSAESSLDTSAASDVASANSAVSSQVAAESSALSDTLVSVATSLDTQFANVFNTAVGNETSNQTLVDGLLASLSSDLTTEGAGAQNADTAALQGQVSELGSTVTSVDNELSSEVKAAISTLDSDVTTANSDLSAAENTLDAQLATVLAELGSNGIIGYVEQSAASTGTNVSQVDSVAGNTHEFGTVRQQEIDSQALAAQQLEDGLQDSQAAGAFELVQPAGSSHTTIFVFTMAGS